jgi:hypothetical protein
VAVVGFEFSAFKTTQNQIFIGELLYDVAVVLGKRIFKEVFSGVLYHP